MLENKLISAVIFDMDGLVLDTEQSYFVAWQQAGQEMGFSLSDCFCQSLSGLHYAAVEEKIMKLQGENFDTVLFGRLSGQLWHKHVEKNGIVLKKGFYDLLAYLKLRQIPFCLATNSRRYNAEECLEYAGLIDVFEHRITRNDVVNGKPEPDIFLAAAKTLNQPIENCLVLEDSLTGIQAAARAGAIPFYIPSVLPPNRTAIELSTLMLDDLIQVKEYLA